MRTLKLQNIKSSIDSLETKHLLTRFGFGQQKNNGMRYTSVSSKRLCLVFDKLHHFISLPSIFGLCS